jgi:hypothetical protein
MNNNTMPPAVNLDAWQDYHMNSPSNPSFPTSCISGFSSILFPQKTLHATTFNDQMVTYEE